MMSKGNKSSSSSGTYSGTDHTVTQNTAPEWVSTAMPQIYGTASSLASANPQSYVAGPSSLQNTAAGNAASLSVPWQLSGASADMNSTMQKAAPQSQAALASGYVGGYLSPYLDQVLNSSLAAFDNQAGQTQAQQDLQMAGNGAFGGSGAAINKALTNGQLQLGRGQLASNIENQGYTTALGAAQSDANNVTQVGVSNANLQNDRLNRNAQLEQALASVGNSINNAQNQNVATQAGLGSSLQQIAQNQATAPLAQQSWLASILSGLPINLVSGQTSTETQNGTQSSTGNSSGFNFGFNLQNGKK